jgi:hypothetical protein
MWLENNARQPFDQRQIRKTTKTLLSYVFGPKLRLFFDQLCHQRNKVFVVGDIHTHM